MPNTTVNKPSKCVMGRIQRQGESHQKNFTLQEYGTWKAAQAAADKWISKMRRKLPKPSDGYGIMNKRNNSGIVGVWPRIKTFKSSQSEIDYCRWYARWPGCPNAGGVSFSAQIFGDDDAFVLAWLAREHNNADRDWVINKLKTFRNTKKYEEILGLKELEFQNTSAPAKKKKPTAKKRPAKKKPAAKASAKRKPKPR